MSTASVLPPVPACNHSWPPELRLRLSDALARPAAQQPDWPDSDKMRQVTALLAESPPLTVPAEVDRLSVELGRVARGEAFLLQGGDCAETFARNSKVHVRANVRLLLHMAVVLASGLNTPVVKVGRIAGQYAKPRSAAVDGLGLPVYRGDIVNSSVPCPKGRMPDATRMVLAYLKSSSTMNLLRALTTESATDLHQVHDWNKNFVRASSVGERYADLATEINLRSVSSSGVNAAPLHTTEIFASHEALLLDYECALVRLDDTREQPRLYDLSSHFLWIGERTRQLDGAHIALGAALLK